MNEKTKAKLPELTDSLKRKVLVFLPLADAYLDSIPYWKGHTVEMCEASRNIYYQAGLYSIGRKFNTFTCKWEDTDKSIQRTWTLNSKHLTGEPFPDKARAIDIAISTLKGKYLWPDPEHEENRKMWTELALIGKSCGLYPGALWKHRKPDWGHYSDEKE